jgi:DNA mismatch repair protein MutL
MPIRVLSQDVIARIAAGEVVERPASVVKELVENSLDAGATQIAVETRSGGVGLVQVADNGGGVPSDEMELAFRRHATSKVSGIGDLESISSLGFRGEALPSIAAVADIEMVARSSESDAGSYVSLKEGNVVGRGTRGHPPGTTLTVRNLFRNVPARLKFLKSTATENSHIAQVVSQYALAYPEVRFSLTSDGRTVLATTGSGRLLDSVLAVYGLETARSMLEIKQDMSWGQGRSEGAVAVTGLVGAPSIARSSRECMSFFVNRRWIGSRLLSRAVEDAYRGLLTTGQHPVAVINIALPPRDVDVNIHPAKSEVKFRDDRTVFGAVQRAVRGTLVELAPVPAVQQPAAVYTAPRSLSPHAGTPLPQTVEGWEALFPVTEDSSPRLSPQPVPMLSLPALRLLGQLAASYIVAEGPDGLYLIDQHAAHERILFERVQRQRSQQRTEAQSLLEPVTLEVTPRQEAVLKPRLSQIAGFGFSLEQFGTNTYLVRAVPAGLDSKAALTVLREILDPPAEGRETWDEKISESIACHGAVRAGQLLSLDEMQQLVREMEQTATPHTCPHGRPTMIHLSTRQLEREFKRT